ncbi:MAG: class I SAM-dependent methyltransferase [Peptococcaceae bacterium]|nr:class I SAM-dependent methyltransferase [Peptococcaceae bacterium]
MEPEMLLLLNRTINLMEGLGYLWVVSTGLELELWSELTLPKSLAQLIESHPTWDHVLLDHWLEQAYCLDLLDKKNQAYRTNKLGRALVAYREQGLAAMYQEFITYWSPCFAALPELIRGNVTKENLQSGLETELVSRASLASEPFVLPLLKAKCQREKWQNILDIGCGEGTCLVHLLTAFPELRGTGIELNPVVAKRATQAAQPFADRLRIVCGDALELDPTLGSYDVCLLNNNIYYFTPERRLALLTRLKPLVKPGGRLGILSALRDSDYRARVFKTYIPQNLMSFFLACHAGFDGLPTETELQALLSQAGFIELETIPLALRTSHYFFARKPV